MGLSRDCTQVQGSTVKLSGGFSLGKFCGGSVQIPVDLNVSVGKAGGRWLQPHLYFLLCNLSQSNLS